MSLTDRLLLGEIGIEGEFEIGITNPLTGRLYRHVKSKNVITNGMYEYLRMAQVDLLRTLYYNGNGHPRCRNGLKADAGMIYDYPIPAVYGVCLTDGVLPENTARRLVDGNIIAYGTSNAAVSTNEKLGNLTPSECYALYNKVVRRWDFSSDKGNGTFSKISLRTPYSTGGYYEVIAVGSGFDNTDPLINTYCAISPPYIYNLPSNYGLKKYVLTEGENRQNSLVASLKKPAVNWGEQAYLIDGSTDKGVKLHDNYEISLVDFTTGQVIKKGYYTDWKNEEGKGISSGLVYASNRSLCFYYNSKVYWYQKSSGIYEADFDTMVISKISAEIISDFETNDHFEIAIEGNNIYTRNYTTKAVYKIDGNALTAGGFVYEKIVSYADMYQVNCQLFGVEEGKYIKFAHNDTQGYKKDGSTYMTTSIGISRVPLVDNAGAGMNASQLDLMAEKLLPEPITKDNMPMYVSYTLKLV